MTPAPHCADAMQMIRIENIEGREYPVLWHWELPKEYMETEEELGRVYKAYAIVQLPEGLRKSGEHIMLCGQYPDGGWYRNPWSARPVMARMLGLVGGKVTTNALLADMLAQLSKNP